MKVLVTGAAGFLGYHLSHHFLGKGIPVVGVDSFISGQRENSDDLLKQKGFQFFEEDINNLSPSALEGKTALNNALKGVTRIFHMACPASPPTYQKDSLHTLETCYTGSKNIFDIALRHKARMLIASTSEIYGDPEVHPQPESYRGCVNTIGPRSCYDEGKRVMETLGYLYAAKGVEVRTARIFNTYGPRMSPLDGRVVTNFIFQALNNEDLTIYGTGEQTRSFCYYSDLIKGLLLLMESGVNEPVNLGSQFEFTINQLAAIVKNKIRPTAEIKYFPLPQDDPKQRRPDSSRAKTLLGWQPEVDLETGILELAEYFRNVKKR